MWKRGISEPISGLFAVPCPFSRFSQLLSTNPIPVVYLHFHREKKWLMEKWTEDAFWGGVFLGKSQTTFLHIHFQRNHIPSQRRRSAQALLTLASPSTQVTQSHSCSRLLFGSAEQKFVNFTRLYLGGPSWLLGSPNRILSKYVFLI